MSRQALGKISRNHPTEAAFFADQVGGGKIASFTKGGVERAQITNDGAFQTGGASAPVVKNHDGKVAIKFVSSRGALQIGCDDSIIIGSGEAAPLVTANVGQEGEHFHMGSDGGLYLYSDLQNGWGSKHTLAFDSSGNLMIDGNRVAHQGSNVGDAAAVAAYDAERLGRIEAGKMLEAVRLRLLVERDELSRKLEDAAHAAPVVVERCLGPGRVHRLNALR